MTNWKIKEEEIEKFLEDWKNGILANIKDKDLIISNNVNGTFRAPSKKKQYYTTAGFGFHKDIFKRKEDIYPFLESICFGFYFVPKNTIDFHSGIESEKNNEEEKK